MKLINFRKRIIQLRKEIKNMALYNIVNECEFA